MLKAIGRRGSWFATFDGTEYPCVHKYWYHASYYHDPNAVPGERQWDELIEAIRTLKRVILTEDDVTGEGTRFTCTAHIGLFEVAELSVDGRDLRFRMTKRLA